MPETRKGRLLGFGPMAWNEVLVLLDGCSAVWADLDGWHVDGGPLPNDRPLATHVWAWNRSSNRWALVRLDGDVAIVGVLDGRRGEEPHPGATLVEDVDYVVSKGVPWGDEQQIPPRGEPVRHLPFEIAEVGGTSPIVFARLTDNS